MSANIVDRVPSSSEHVLQQYLVSYCIRFYLGELRIFKDN